VRAPIILIVTSMWEMFTRTGCPDDHAATDFEAFTNIDLTVIRLPDRYGRNFTVRVVALIPMKPSVKACDRSRRRSVRPQGCLPRSNFAPAPFGSLNQTSAACRRNAAASLGGWKSARS
jgi:hypothetical protein